MPPASHLQPRAHREESPVRRDTPTIGGHPTDRAAQGAHSIAVDLIKHAKSGDKTAFAATDARWTRNGDDIADFLSKSNPYWPRATLAQRSAGSFNLEELERTAIERALLGSKAIGAPPPTRWD